MKNVCVIETGLARESLVTTFGAYPDTIEALLKPHLPDTNFTTTSVVQGHSLPTPKDFDGYIIMGSRHSVYDDLPWIGPLRSFIQEITSQQIPLVGICFGHQIIAEALGGKVEAAEEGWILGVHEYSVPGIASSIKSMAYHHDQIVKNPPNIDIVMKSESCANGGCVYQDFPAFSVQPHPEFEQHFTTYLLNISRQENVPKTIIDGALAAITTPIHPQRFARAMAKVLMNKADTETLSRCLSSDEQ